MTLYMFFIHLLHINGIQNIIGIKTYGDAEDPYTALIGSDSEMCRIIFIKNKSVVYEDDYYYYEYRLNLQFETFHKISGYGIFDGNLAPVRGYMCTKRHFTVRKVSDDEYIMFRNIPFYFFREVICTTANKSDSYCKDKY